MKRNPHERDKSLNTFQFESRVTVAKKLLSAAVDKLFLFKWHASITMLTFDVI